LIKTTAIFNEEMKNLKAKVSRSGIRESAHHLSNAKVMQQSEEEIGVDFFEDI